MQCRWHDARHTFISKIGESAVSDRTIMALAGHVSKKMLERYSHIGNTAKRQAITAAFDTATEPAKKIKKQATQKQSLQFPLQSEGAETGRIM